MCVGLGEGVGGITRLSENNFSEMVDINILLLKGIVESRKNMHKVLLYY